MVRTLETKHNITRKAVGETIIKAKIHPWIVNGFVISNLEVGIPSDRHKGRALLDSDLGTVQCSGIIVIYISVHDQD